MLLHLIRDHGGLFLILVVASRTEDEDQQNGEPQNSGTLTLDDTSEFVRSINVAPAQARAKQEAIVVKIDTSHMHEPSEGEEVGSWLLSCKLEPNYPMIRLGPQVNRCSAGV